MGPNLFEMVWVMDLLHTLPRRCLRPSVSRNPLVAPLKCGQGGGTIPKEPASSNKVQTF